MSTVEVRSSGKGCWRVFVDGQELSRVGGVELDWPTFNSFPEVIIRLLPDEFRVAHDPDGPSVRLDDKPGMGFRVG